MRDRVRLLAGPLIVIAAITIYWANPFAASLTRTEVERVRLVTLAENLNHPWGLAFLPNGDMLVTERVGQLRRVRTGGLGEVSWIYGIPRSAVHEEAGLMDVATHPKFNENGLIYLTYSKEGKSGNAPAIYRARLDDTRLVDGADIFVTDAWSAWGGNAGSRIVFGRDGMIYMSVGDRGTPNRAQNLGEDAGKILRLRDDGSIPDDNPFVGRPNIKPEIYSYGNRNSQGLAIDHRTGALFENEHGPRGGDEINLIEAGRNYGWPVITYGINYDGSVITNETKRPGMEQPLTYWVPSIGPSGMVVYNGDRFPHWQNNLFVGSLAGTHLRRIVLDGMRVVHQETLLVPLERRIRDVRQGPDGFLYILTDATHGALIRIEPAHGNGQ